LGGLVGCIGVAGVLHAGADPQEVPERPPRSVSDRGALPGALHESSGLVVSRVHPGVLWSHNDSGDEPRLFALDTVAGLVGVWTVSGAEATDWEALDVGPCPAEGSRSCLYVGDLGDNGLRRESVVVWIVPEPDPADPARVAPALGSVRLRYASGPDDVEALAVDASGDLVLVTKGRRSEIRAMTVPAEDVRAALRTGEVIRVDAGTPLPIRPDWISGRVVTGAGIDRSGRVLALRTYASVILFSWPLADPPDPLGLPCTLKGLQRVGESVAFLDDGRLALTSETLGAAGHLLVVDCPVPEQDRSREDQAR